MAGDGGFVGQGGGEEVINNEERFYSWPPACFDGVFHWDFLFPAFEHEKTGIEPMDFDGVVERNGCFLGFETKEPGTVIPKGQQIALARAVATGVWTVIFLPAKSQHEITRWQVWWLSKSGSAPGAALVKRRWHVGSSQGLVEFVARWFRWASKQRRPVIEIKDL